MLFVPLACAAAPLAIIYAAVALRGRATPGSGRGSAPHRPLFGSWAGCCLVDAVATGEIKPSTVPLRKAGDVPHLLRRPGILTGYRFALTVGECARSLLAVHNEVLCSWTHMLPIGWCAAVAWDEWGRWAAGETDSTDFAIAAAFLTHITLCLGASTVYHTFGCQSEATCWNLCHADHVGVVMGTGAAYWPGLYYGYTCERWLQLVYSVAAATVFVSVLSLMQCGQWRTEEWGRVRLLALGSLLVLGVVPSAHFIALHWYSDDLPVFLAMIVEAYGIMIVGVTFYVSGFPESRFPGLFDLTFYSHMWWHICVATAFVRLYYLWTEMRTYRAVNGCPPL